MNILEKVKQISLSKIKHTDYSLYDVEYVKEGRDYFLRIYFDKDGGLSLDDCVYLSEIIAEELDKEDFITEAYYLEISSPGVERELRNLDEVIDAVGKYVYIKTYEKIDSQKEFYADLLAVDNEVLLIEYKDKSKTKKSNIEYKKIAKIRLAVKF